ncbi:hypothetical protein ACFE04_022693 [Oxalis oulophora]
MAFIGSSLANDVGLKLILSPIGSNIVMRTACCGVGIGLPVYSTFKAIERKDQNEQQKWLIYWAAYGSFSLVEVFADKLVSWFPMYYHMKFAFLVWLQLPSVEGAKQIYQSHLRPFFLRHQARADQILGFAYSEMAKLISRHQTEIQFTRSLIMKLTGSGNGPDNQIPGRVGEPGQPLGRPGRTLTEASTRNSDSESDHEE